MSCPWITSLCLRFALYAREEKKEEEEIDDSEEFDENVEDDIIEVVIPEPQIASNYKEVVTKVRRIVKIFRKSPVQNDDALQPIMYIKFGKS